MSTLSPICLLNCFWIIFFFFATLTLSAEPLTRWLLIPKIIMEWFLKIGFNFSNILLIFTRLITNFQKPLHWADTKVHCAQSEFEGSLNWLKVQIFIEIRLKVVTNRATTCGLIACESVFHLESLNIQISINIIFVNKQLKCVQFIGLWFLGLDGFEKNKYSKTYKW